MQTTLLGALTLVLTAAPVSAQQFCMATARVPASDEQVGGPNYNYLVGTNEVTNAQFATFLNDAEFHNADQNPGFGDERGDNMAFRQPPFGGDVGLVVGDSSDVDAIFDISRSLLVYDDLQPVGSRFTITAGKGDHPVVGVSWFGAVKFCNWLTIDYGLVLTQRCYVEGASELDWFPATTGTDVGGSQQLTNLARDLNDTERGGWVRRYRGFRLLMDQGGIAVGAVNAAPRPFNEWYKAAAFHPGAPNVRRTVFSGFPFEQHIVPPHHWVHGYGRDLLSQADANYRNSGDPFDAVSSSVIATTPVGYYNGTSHGGVFGTNNNANRYGINDMSGNVWEFLNDQVRITDSSAPDRAIAGGSYRSNIRQVTAANRGDIGPGSTRPVVGFRVARVLAARPGLQLKLEYPGPPCW